MVFRPHERVKRIKSIVDAIISSPGWKTLFLAVLPVISGVLSGAFIVEITVGGSLDWTLFYKARSFCALIVLTLIIYIYHRLVYRREVEISKFSDTDFCVAYMRSKCLPEAAERFKQLIRDGRGGELVEIMEEVKLSLK